MKSISGVHDVLRNPQAGTSPTCLIFDRNFLREAAEVDDYQILLELFHEYIAQLRQLQFVVAEAHNSSARVPELEQLCHNLKSSSTEVGAFQLAHSLTELEQARLNKSDRLQPLLSITSYFLDATLTEVEAEVQRIMSRTD
jgi:HPt (histidine-containing phosphotransfer) domain-containing protein